MNPDIDAAPRSDPAKTIIGVTRSARGLTARALTVSPLNIEAKKLPDAMTQADYPALCRMEAYSLQDCPVSTNDGQKRLARAWQALASVQAADADTLLHVLIVLLETVVEAEQMPALPPLAFGTQAANSARRPTAAHPRAFRGTTYQPPKIKTPACHDLRPYLCDAQSVAYILTRLRPFWHTAVERLAQAGYDVRNLQSDGLDDSGLYALYTRVHHGQNSDADAARLPSAFGTVLLPLLRGLPWDEVKRYLALFWNLQLDVDTPLLAAFARLLICQNDARTRQWGELLIRQPAAWRVTFCVFLTQTGAYRLDPAALDGDALHWLEELEGQRWAAYRLYCLLRALVIGVDTNYLRTGFHLADTYAVKNWPFHELVHSAVCPPATIERIGARIRLSSEWHSARLLSVWKTCGELTGFAQAMDTIMWETYTPDVTNRYVGIFLSISWQDWTNAQKQCCWRFLRQNIPLMEIMLHNTAPAFQEKCVALLGACVWEWGERGEAATLFARACPLIRRLCAPPFRRQLPDMRLFAQFLDAGQHDALMAAPDSSWLRLEEALARQNNATLVQAGFWSLLRVLPLWAVTCFQRYPAKLCKVARLLGCFSDELRDHTARLFHASLPNGLDGDDTVLRLLPLEELRDQINAACAPDCTDPVPRPIREHLAGRKILDAPRLAHHRADMEKGLRLAQLEMLEAAALDVLCRGYETGADNSTALHALQMRCHIADNRRAFGKFLRAYIGGDTSYIAAHPRSQAWLARHPTLNRETWLRGVEVGAVLLEGVSGVQIGVEQNPLEALKMGTAVGSCLGLGGSFAYSAIANVLDINKQVIYARDENGNILARQLAAISEEGALVCFDIYPMQADVKLQRLFRRYDELWADALNLSLYRNEPDTDYTIVNVLSAHWWDDHPWDFTIDEDVACLPTP